MNPLKTKKLFYFEILFIYKLRFIIDRKFKKINFSLTLLKYKICFSIL